MAIPGNFLIFTIDISFWSLSDFSFGSVRNFSLHDSSSIEEFVRFQFEFFLVNQLFSFSLRIFMGPFFKSCTVSSLLLFVACFALLFNCWEQFGQKVFISVVYIVCRRFIFVDSCKSLLGTSFWVAWVLIVILVIMIVLRRVTNRENSPCNLLIILSCFVKACYGPGDLFFMCQLWSLVISNGCCHSTDRCSGDFLSKMNMFGVTDLTFCRVSTNSIKKPRGFSC